MVKNRKPSFLAVSVHKMRAFMLSQLTRIRESQQAFLAFVRPLTGVPTYMAMQVCGLDETFLTECTFVRPLSSMNAFVLVQIARLVEAFAAELALERPFARVNAFVVGQGGLRRKRFAAESTVEDARRFASGNPKRAGSWFGAVIITGRIRTSMRRYGTFVRQSFS